MAVTKVTYPVNTTVAMTFVVGALASDTTLLAGRASTAVDNTTNLDDDHLVSGSITVGTTPTANSIIEVWAYVPRSLAANVPTYPDSITGTDAAKTMSSRNVMFAALKLVASITVDAVTGRVYDVPLTSIAQFFNGWMPPFWGLFLVHNMVAANGSVVFQYERIQQTTV